MPVEAASDYRMTSLAELAILYDKNEINEEVRNISKRQTTERWQK